MSGKITSDFGGWMRDIERRLARQERRGVPNSAAASLGPGLASTGSQIADWNGDEVMFNGTYYAEVGSLNSPDNTKRWIGLTLIDDTGAGHQRLMSFPSNTDTATGWTQATKQRVFNTPDGTTRVYSAWV